MIGLVRYLGTTAISLPGLPPKGGEQVVDRICLWTDEPKGFLAAAREHLERDYN